MKTRIASKDDLAVSINIPDRHLAVVTGSMLLLNAFRKKPFGYLQAIVGAALLYRGISRQRFFGNTVSTAEKAISTVPRKLSFVADSQQGSCEVKATVNKPIGTVYRFFKDISTHLPFKTIEKQGGFWRFKLEEKEFYFQATLLEDKKDQILSWQSIEAGNFSNAGIMVFTAQGQQTLVELYFTFSATNAPAGLEKKLEILLKNELDLAVDKLNKV